MKKILINILILLCILVISGCSNQNKYNEIEPSGEIAIENLEEITKIEEIIDSSKIEENNLITLKDNNKENKDLLKGTYKTLTKNDLKISFENNLIIFENLTNNHIRNSQGNVALLDENNNIVRVIQVYFCDIPKNSKVFYSLYEWDYFYEDFSSMDFSMKGLVITEDFENLSNEISIESNLSSNNDIYSKITNIGNSKIKEIIVKIDLYLENNLIKTERINIIEELNPREYTYQEIFYNFDGILFDDYNATIEVATTKNFEDYSYVLYD